MSRQEGPDSKQQAGSITRSSRDEPAGWTKLEIAAVLAVGIAYSVGVIVEWGPLNGIPALTNWEWPWRNLGILRTALMLLAPLAAIAWVVWTIEKGVSHLRVWFVLAVLVVSNFAMQVGGILADPRGFELLKKIVASPITTGYYTDALAIQQPIPTWLGKFHEPAFQKKLHNHSPTHPPGPILFYYVFVKLFGPSTGAILSACAIGLAGSLGILVLYKFTGLWTQDPRTRLLASAFYAVLPALVLFFPEFDQIYPICTMLMILFWIRALNRSPKYACYLGALLFATTFFVYNVLAAGVFLVYYMMYWLWREGWRRSAYGTVLASAGLVLGVWVGMYLALWGTTGYHPIAALQQALLNQAKVAVFIERPYIRGIIADPYDFALGAGVIALLIAVFYVWRSFPAFSVKRTDIALSFIALATIMTVDGSGLLRGEASRVWLFLQPLLTVPAALELSRLRRSWLLAIFVLQWWIIVCLKAKMDFVRP